jgi:hypothetical protein
MKLIPLTHCLAAILMADHINSESELIHCVKQKANRGVFLFLKELPA